ncbi:MAG: hypothetical protein HC903_18695 [Methylacidiphilales bacterium]|nr:hypothetical protein [Candidatus Methylacidiphilales bacterium]
MSNIIQSSELNLALDENTPSQVLKELAQSQSDKIRFAVAENPNTSPEILKGLFSEFPIQVLNNFALDLILLENPDFLEELYGVYGRKIRLHIMNYQFSLLNGVQIIQTNIFVVL